MRHGLLLLLVLATTPSVADTTFVREMVTDAALLRDLRDMVARADALGGCKAEVAAFLVRRSDGGLALVAWPGGCEALQKKFRGVVPPRTVAIVHTHPGNRKNPSPGDIDQAMRLKMPICVLTRYGVWMADPHLGKPVAILDDPAWMLTR